MSGFESVSLVFEKLNESVPYLVLRNFEGFYDSVLSDEHADIDLLCYKKDRKRIVKLLNARPRFDKDDGIHYYFVAENFKIPLDIRFTGDGYYDKNWENAMLGERIKDSKGFYRMDTENYFWSLLYHALYHKGDLSKEYEERLKSMDPTLFPCTKDDLDEALNGYLRSHKYRCTISKDKYLWYHFSDRCKGNIHAYPMYRIKRAFINCGKKFFRIFKHKRGR